MATEMERLAATQLDMGLTVNSGAYNNDADLIDAISVAECKCISSKNVIVSNIVLRKLGKQRKLWHKRFGFVVTTVEGNGDNEDDTFVTIPLSMFAQVYKVYKHCHCCNISK